VRGSHIFSRCMLGERGVLGLSRSWQAVMVGCIEGMDRLSSD